MLLTAAVWLTLMINGPEMKNTKLQIPYSPKDTAHCYDRLPKMREVYRNGVEEIRRILEGPDPLEGRFRAAMTAHQQVLDRSQETPPVQEFVEEDFYLCCIYDMLEAAVVAETSAALQAGEKNRLDAAKQAIAALPFGSPQYRTGIRPRLEKHVDSALKKLGPKKK